MAGLEKITRQIIHEAEVDAESILENARQNADAIMEKAKETCLAMEAEAEGKLESMRLSSEKRRESSMDQLRRQAMLGAKQAIIKEILEDACQRIKEEDAEIYFQNMIKLIQTYALAKDGEIYFSEKDLGRMPKGYEKKILEAARVKGGSLKLMKEGRPISDGFILAYGGIEENCTFKALIDGMRDRLQDKINEILFV